MEIVSRRLGMNGMILFYLKLDEHSKCEWTDIFFNSKYQQRLNSRLRFHAFQVSWQKDPAEPWIASQVTSYFTGHDRRAWRRITSLIHLRLAKRLTRHNVMSLATWYCEIINTYCFWTGAKNQYRNLQAEIHFEATRFRIALLPEVCRLRIVQLVPELCTVLVMT